jgi:small subunit ribosomal protein S5
MKAASPGTGVIAGSVVRAVVEAAGIKNIRTKCIGSSNPQNVLQAVFDGLVGLRIPEVNAMVRRIPLEEIGYVPH